MYNPYIHIYIYIYQCIFYTFSNDDVSGICCGTPRLIPSASGCSVTVRIDVLKELEAERPFVHLPEGMYANISIVYI